MAIGATLKWGKVILPVSLDGVMKERNGKVSFKTLHQGEDHLAPIKQHKFCTVCGEEVTKENSVSGFEVSKGEYLPVTEADKESVETSSDKTIGIHKWIEPLDPLWFDKSYWLSPKPMFEPSYSLFSEAVKKSGLWGFGSSTVWGEHPVVVRSESGVLIATMLHSQPEFNSAGRPTLNVEIDADDQRTIDFYVEEMNHWSVPLDETDLLVSEDVLMKSLIQSKLDGSEFVPPVPVETPPATVDMLAALKETKAMRPKKRKLAA